MKRTTISEIYKSPELFADKEITVAGWAKTIRSSNAFGFIELGDGSFFSPLQIVFEADKLDNYKDIAKQNVGAALIARGTLVLTPEAKQPFELKAAEIEVEGTSTPDFPLQKKRHSLEFLRTIAHLRPRANTFNAVFRVRSCAAQGIHKFFAEQGFVYVNTPLITVSDCEGAGEMFKVTTIGYSDKYRSAEEYYADDFFGRRAGLSVSGQLEGEMAAMAFGKIYTFGPSFRAENSNTPRHVAEFWHVEPEVAFAELPDIIEIAQDMIKSIIRETMEKCPDELAFFEKHFESGLLDKLQSVIDSDFAVLDYTDAVKLLEQADVEFKYPVFWGCDLQTEHERYITEQVMKKPVFVTNYPKEIKSFYMKQNPDGKTVAATDLLVPGVGEIIGCSEREADYDKLLTAMEERHMDLSAYQDYLDLRRFGSVPHSGFGLGFERILMYVTGVANIRDVQLFPRTVGSIR